MSLLVAPRVAALPTTTAVEIDARAELVLDPRAVRRLVQLELADVEVPPRAGAGDTSVALFVRVLAVREGELRVELWERGESCGARTVAGPRGAAALTARRVALAAAELARGLRQRRLALERAAERARARDELLSRIAREKTLDGPSALKVGVTGSVSDGLALLGPAMDAELDVYGATRLDLGATWSFGVLGEDASAEAWSLRVGPARRFVLGRTTDLDLGVRAEASILSFRRALAVDGMQGQNESWAARVEGVGRFEPRLSRAVRLSLGVFFGVSLRRPGVELVGGERVEPGRFHGGAELGLVLTPALGR